MPPPTHSDPHISQHHPLDHQTKTKTTHTTHQRTKTKTNISHRRSHTHTAHITARSSISVDPNTRHHDLYQSKPMHTSQHTPSSSHAQIKPETTPNKYQIKTITYPNHNLPICFPFHSMEISHNPH